MPSKPPAPPDPRETSAAQTGSSVSTAIANAMMGNVSQNTPQGSLNYEQTGSYKFTDPYTGQSYDIPTFTANQTYSPEQQAIYDTTLGTQQNLADLAQQQSGFLKDYMAQPVDLSNEATEARLYELGSQRLDPRFARQEQDLRTNLINRGIREGSAAWTNAMSDLNAGRNDAYNQLLLQGRGQATQEALAERNQPINEIAALMSGSQVSQPNFVNPNMPTIPTTDNAGLINQNYQQKQQNAQQQNAFMQNIMGGLFGLGSAGIMASDERVKDDIKKVGETNDDQPIYQFRYKGSPMMQLGLMAQEVEKKKPAAVVEVGGIKHVDYRKALENA